MGGGYTSTPPAGHLNGHDVKVIAFHVAVAAIQAALVTLGTYSSLFGAYAPYVMLGVQVTSEFVRRLVD